MSRTVSLVLVAALVGGAPGLAAAGPLSPQVRTVVVRVPVGDLDLSQEAGADAFLSRVARAASKACGGGPLLGVTMHEEAQAYRKCKTQALEQAVARAESPAVSARYAVRTGGAVYEVANVRPD